MSLRTPTPLLTYQDLNVDLDELGVNVKSSPFNAVGDGIADDTAAIQAAITVAQSNHTPVYLPAGTFKVTSSFANLTTGVRITGVGKGISILSHAAVGVSLFTTSGTFASTTTLTAGAALGATQITVASTTGIVAKDLFLLRDPTVTFLSNEDKSQVAAAGEWVRVRSVDSPTLLTLWGRLKRAYTTGSDLRKASTVKDLTFDNFSIVNALPGSAGFGANGMTLVGAERVRVHNLEFRDMDSNSVYLQTCYDVEVIDTDFYDSRDLESANAPYSIMFKNGTQHGLVSNCRQKYGRHLVTTGPSGDGLEIPSADVLVHGCIATQMSEAAFDTHPGSERFVFADCYAHQCLSSGFQIRGPNSSVINPQVYGALRGVYFVYGADNGVIQGGVLDGCDVGVMIQDSNDCVVRGTRIRNAVTRGLHVQVATAAWANYITQFKAENIDVMGSPATAAFAFDQWNDNFELRRLTARDATTKISSVNVNTPTLYGLDGDGFPGILVPTASGSTRGNVTMVANRAWLTRFVAPRNMTITKLTFAVTTAAGSDDEVDVGIYGPHSTANTLTRLGSKGATTGQLNTLGLKTITITGVKLVAGTVYYAAISNGAIGTTAATIGGVGLNNTTVNQLMGSTVPLQIVGAKDTSHPLPSTIGGPSQQLLGPSMGVLE